MTDRARDLRPRSLHQRLTVALAGAEERGRLADALTQALGGGATDAGPLRADDLLQAAASFAALRAHDRAALRSRLDDIADRAADDLAAACTARDELAGRRDALLTGAAWVAGAPAEIASRRRTVDEARDRLDDRSADLREAQAVLGRVLEQRAAAAAAVEEADRQLADVDAGGMDERGLRRELDLAGRAVRERTTALHDAMEALAALEDEREAAGHQRDALVAALGDEPAHQPAPAVATEAVLDAFDAFRHHAMVARTDPVAVELAQAWRDLTADLLQEGATDAPRPSEADLHAAAAEAAAAAAQLHRLEEERAGRRLSADQRAAIDAAHAAVADAEDRARRRIGGGAARRQLQAARALEEALLAQAGFASYLQVVLTGGKAGLADPVLDDAERRYLAATANLEELQRARYISPTIAYLESERERLRAHTIEVLGVDPGSSPVALLEAHPGVPPRVVAELRDALAQVGVCPVGRSLGDAAEAWLVEQRQLSERQRAHAAQHAAEQTALVELEARIRDLDVRLTDAHQAVAEAAEALELSQRTVDAVDAEITSRSGADTKRLKRLAAAEQLRAQVDALETRLASAEADARAGLEATMTSVAAAEVAHEQAALALAELAGRARSLVQALPVDQRPEGEPFEVLDVIGSGLTSLAATLEPALDEAQEAVDVATARHEEARDAARLAAQFEQGPQRDDFVEGLTQLLHTRGDTDVLVLDDPFECVDRNAREDLLALIRDGSTRRQVVLLTEDPEVLGWAIEQPADVATAVPAVALFAHDPDRSHADDRTHTPARHDAGRH